MTVTNFPNLSALTFSTGLTRTTNTITNNLSVGVSGGQSVIGGIALGNSLTLQSTSHATKGTIIFGNGTTDIFDDVNDRWGFGAASPAVKVQIVSTTEQFRSGQSTSIYWGANTAATTGITTLTSVGGTLPSFWLANQTVLGNTQTPLTDPRTVVIGQIKDRVYTQMNQGVFQITAPANSVYSNAFDKNMGIFFDIDNSTIYYAGTGVIQFYSALNTGGPLAINPNGGGVSINTSLFSPIDNSLGLLVGGNASNNAFVKVRNNTSYGGSAYPYSGYLFQQAVGTTYVKAGILYDAYDGTGGGYGRGRLLFCVNGVLDGSNVQDTVVASSRMNIDYVAGVVTIGQGVTVGTGKLNVLSTTEQFRAYYDTSNFFSTTVASTGSTTFALTGTSPTFSFSQKVILGNTLRLKGYLVSALSGLSPVQGDKAFVTDALAPTYLVTVVGGGAVVTEVFYNGTNWVCT